VAVDRIVLTAETLLRERALRVAVLIDAVRCLVGLAGDRERRVAVRWVVRRDDAPFSFGNVCEALDLPRTRVRQMMLDPTLGLDTAMFRTSLAHHGPRRVGYVVQQAGTGT